MSGTTGQVNTVFAARPLRSFVAPMILRQKARIGTACQVSTVLLGIWRGIFSQLVGTHVRLLGTFPGSFGMCGVSQAGIFVECIYMYAGGVGGSHKLK